MTDYHKNTQDLIRDIEREDRRFRVFQAISISLVGLGVIALLGLNYNIQRQNHALTLQLKQSVADLKKNNSAKLSDLQKHMDCLFKLATTPHSTTDTISVPDISTCQITNSSLGGATGGTKSPVTYNASQTKANTPHNDPRNKTGADAVTPATPQPSQGFLQKITLTPIVRFIRGLF